MFGKNKNKRLLYKLKTSAITLRKNLQLPSKLYDLIMRVTLNDTEDYIKFLSGLSEDYLRIKGYYKDVEKHNTSNNEVARKVAEFKMKKVMK